MNAQEILIEQFEFCFDKKNWFVSLKDSVEGLSATDATQKNNLSVHSIAELVQHLYFWNERLLKKFKGLEVPEITGGNDSTFFTHEEKVSKEAWKQRKEKLFSVLEELKKEFSKADEDKLKSSPYKNGSGNWKSVMANINAHNAYHTGQIVLLRKLQGNWKEEMGVK